LDEGVARELLEFFPERLTMNQRVGTAVRIAVLLTAVLTALSSSAQVVIDYELQVLAGGVPYPGGEIVFGMVVTANWSTNEAEPFVVHMNVPVGLEPTYCLGGDGEMQFDPITRVLTWNSHLDNPGLAFSSCPLRLQIDPAVAPGTVLTVTAKLTTPVPDPNPANDTASATTVVISASDLEVRSSADRRNVKPGDTIAYTLTIKNLGPQPAQNAILANQFSTLVDFVSLTQTSGPIAFIEPAPDPGYTWIRAILPLLPVDATATFRLVVVAKTSFESADIVNRVIAETSMSADIVERNNTFYEVVLAGPNTDLTITSSVAEGARRRGTETSRSTVVLRITNEGPEHVNAVTVESELATAAWQHDFAALARFASVTPSQGTCTTTLNPGRPGHPPSPESWGMHCELGALAAGAAATITVVIESAPGAGPFGHSAVVRPHHNDPRPENNETHLAFGMTRRRAARH
ncbi:MAG TPA: hypothetical protein VE010_17470, partial [Thermoanaerobaculia bacterium]|nr:hypothetical protein [Thermoanaerobaculia bacterium]